MAVWGGGWDTIFLLVWHFSVGLLKDSLERQNKAQEKIFFIVQNTPVLHVACFSPSRNVSREYMKNKSCSYVKNAGSIIQGKFHQPDFCVARGQLIYA